MSQWHAHIPLDTSSLSLTLSLSLNGCTRARKQTHRAHEPAARVHSAGPGGGPQERACHQGDLAHVRDVWCGSNADHRVCVYVLVCERMFVGACVCDIFMPRRYENAIFSVIQKIPCMRVYM